MSSNCKTTARSCAQNCCNSAGSCPTLSKDCYYYYNGTIKGTTTTTTTTTLSDSGVIGIAVGGAFLFIIIMVSIVCAIRRRRLLAGQLGKNSYMNRLPNNTTIITTEPSINLPGTLAQPVTMHQMQPFMQPTLQPMMQPAMPVPMGGFNMQPTPNFTPEMYNPTNPFSAAQAQPMQGGVYPNQMSYGM